MIEGQIATDEQVQELKDILRLITKNETRKPIEAGHVLCAVIGAFVRIISDSKDESMAILEGITKLAAAYIDLIQIEYKA